MTLAGVAESAKRIASAEGIETDKGRIRFTDQFRQGVLETVKNFEADPEFKLPERIETVLTYCETEARLLREMAQPNAARYFEDISRRLREIREGK